jgi:hypothetical protein
MGVGYCYCKRVGGIVGFRDFAQMKNLPCHFHNLRFFGLSVACNGGLDLKRRIFLNRQTS